MKLSAVLVARLLPFFGLGIALILLCAALVLFSYVFIIGAIFGFILLTIASVRSYFTRKRHLQRHQPEQTVWRSYFETTANSTSEGRTYDQDGNER